MRRKPPTTVNEYALLLGDIKGRIRQSQTRAVLAVNSELIRLYWDIGRILDARQIDEGYGTAVIPRLAKDLKNELPEVKGFSERNIDNMIRIFRAYSDSVAVSQQAAAKLPQLSISPQAAAKLTKTAVSQQAVAKLAQTPISPLAVAKLPQILKEVSEAMLWCVPWGHHVVLLQKIKDLDIRLWYMRQTIEQGWSRAVLTAMIDSKAHARQGKAVSNFAERLPPAQSDLVTQSLKDPYIFDFLTLAEPFQERELETGLIRHVQKFLMELGQGFAFVGRQCHVEVEEEDFYIDLLFYHLKLRCYVVIELKKGTFKPEYAGKMNFYLNVVDDKLRHSQDAPSIGLILCQDRNKVIAEYALRGMTKPIGVSEYELTRSLPKELRSSLPTIEAIEAELAELPHEPRSRKGKSPKK